MPPPRSRRRFDDEDEDDERPRRRRRDEDEDDEDDRPRSRRRDEEDDDDDDRPRRGRGRAKGSNGLATTALVLGILSFLCSGLTGIPAVICGFLGLSKANRVGTGKGLAIAGMVLGVIGTLASAAGGVYFMKYSVEKVRDAAGKQKSNNDLKEIGLGTLNFENANGTFPRSYHVPGGANPPADPSARLSWRYSLLPYVEEPGLFSRMAPDQAWDSPRNRPGSDTYVRVYCATEGVGSNQTRYRVLVGGGAVFDADPPRANPGGVPQLAQPTRIVGITDGTSNTILAVEAADTVPWAQHKELKFDPNGPLPPLGRPGRDTFIVVMCDGATRVVKKSVDPAVLKKAITRSAGEVLPLDW